MTKPHMLNGIAISVVLLFMTITSCKSAEAVFVVHKDCPIIEVSKKDIQRLFLGKKQSWRDGARVALYVQEMNSVHEDIVRTYCKKTPSQFRAYWKKRVFTGKSGMPKSLKSDLAVILEISKSNGAIGYISQSNVSKDDSVKILQIVD